MVTKMSNCKTISYNIYFHKWIDKYRTEQDNIFQINSNIKDWIYHNKTCFCFFGVIMSKATVLEHVHKLELFSMLF